MLWLVKSKRNSPHGESPGRKQGDTKQAWLFTRVRVRTTRDIPCHTALSSLSKRYVRRDKSRAQLSRGYSA